MTLYRWRAIDSRGEVVEGETEALDNAQVLEQLHREGRLVLHNESVGRHLLAPGLAGMLEDFTSRRRLMGREGILLYSGLAALLGVGLPVDRALEVTARLCRRTPPCRVATTLLVGVRAGAPLAEAMEAMGGVFPEHAVRMVRAGEAVAALPIVARRLAAIGIQARQRWASALPAVASTRAFVAAMAFRVPGLGPRRRSAEASRLLGGLSVLLANGIGPAAALEVLRHASPNPAIRASLDQAWAGMRTGGDLAGALAGLWWLPPVVAQTIAAAPDPVEGLGEALTRL